jgi:hypothetical protein
VVTYPPDPLPLEIIDLVSNVILRNEVTKNLGVVGGILRIYPTSTRPFAFAHGDIKSTFDTKPKLLKGRGNFLEKGLRPFRTPYFMGCRPSLQATPRRFGGEIVGKKPDDERATGWDKTRKNKIEYDKGLASGK